MTKRDYKDFLNNNDFISWRLTGDPGLENFWEEYLESHPEQREEFEKAIRKFSYIRLNTERLNRQEEEDLLKRIHRSAEGTRKKRFLLRFAGYAAAACILLAAGLFFFNKSGDEVDMTGEQIAGLIVGEDLDEKEIYLITETETSSFSKDVHVKMDGSGSAIIEEVDGGSATVVKAGKAVMNKLVVPYGKRSQLTLSDGSRVWVNSGSVLEFPSVFTEKTRSVKLVGEMFIEVAKDKEKPFLVHTPDLQVKVYGTEFNISAYQDERAQSVVLVSGSVGVKSAVGGETYLSPSEMLVYANQSMEKKGVDTDKYISWKEGYIILEDTPMVEVLRQLERYYNLSFDIRRDANLESRTCRGKLYLSDNLDNVMATIALLASVKYTRDGKNIYIDINP